MVPYPQPSPTARSAAIRLALAELLTRLTEANHLLTEARDPLANTRRLLLRAKTSLDTGQAELRTLQPKTARRLRTLNADLADTRGSRLLSAHGFFEGRLRSCSRALEPSLPHVRRRPALLT